MYIFISHSSKDAESAEKVCMLLEKAGHQCFIAPRDIPSGKEYAQELMQGIERSDAMVLMLSESANSSPHVLREVEHAASRSLPILVYKLEEVTLTKSMEYFLMTHQWINQKPGRDYNVIVQSIKNLQMDPEVNDATPKEPDGNGHRPRREVLLKGTIVSIILFTAAAVFIVNRTEDAARQAEAARIDLQLGDAVTLGTYNDEPIVWKVVHLSEDAGRAVLVTEDILTMKAYDAAESDRYNQDGGNDYWKYACGDFEDQALEAKVRGSNEWENSNIRSWLNADTQAVDYVGGSPINTVMSTMKNGYANEAGFLHGFTDAEKAVILETQVESNGNVLTDDKVFLLSLAELEWLREADIGILAKPTDAAVSRDTTGWYKVFSLDYGVDTYYWWLREPAEGSASQCYLVSNGYTQDETILQEAGLEGYGIRPAVTIDVQALAGLGIQ